MQENNTTTISNDAIISESTECPAEEVKTVNIMGDDWMVIIRPSKDDSLMIEEGADGYCDPTAKLIVVNDLNDEAHESMGDKTAYMKQCLRHELIHAALFSSGLSYSWEHSEHGHDETTIDWFASQWSKLAKIFEQAGAV